MAGPVCKGLVIIYRPVSAATVLARVLQRDAAAMGGPAEVRTRYQQRYLPGQAPYRAASQPEQRADGLIQYDTPARLNGAGL